MGARLALTTAVATGALALSACELRNSEGDDAAPAASAEKREDAAGPAPPPALPEPAPDQPALGQSESENGDFRLAVTEASRSAGVLTLKARVTLIGGESGRRRILYSNEAGDPYLLSGDQKYMMLADNEGVPLTTQDGYEPNFSRLGDTNAWWAKYPAPPPEVKSVGLHFRGFLPIENIPISDR